MGIREALFGVRTSDLVPVKAVSFETVNPNPLVTITSTGQEVTIDLSDLLGAGPAQMFRTQPYLRAVVSFLARNIAQLGLHTYRRVSDTDRVRDTTSVTAQLIRSPNNYTTRYELLTSLVSDLALWDQAFWMVTPDSQRDSGWRVTPIPVAWVDKPFGGDYFEPTSWRITRPGKTTVEVDAQNVVHFHGWDPEYINKGISPVLTLRNILAEQIAAVLYRQQRWERGARVGYVLTRPTGAPRWSQEAEERFKSEWREKFQSARGSEAGGTPILQDGMTLTKMGFSAVEDEFVEASKLALTTVASVFHVNPTMLGLLDNANYSNVREFRRMLYGDTLGPWLSMIEDRFNGFVIPKVEPEPSDLYVEFNIAEKLQGSFEEQATVASMAVGGPYMTRNEYRVRQNLPPIDGGDELIVPMNVTEGGQASPQDSAPTLSQIPLRMAAPGRARRTGGRSGGQSPRAKLRASEGQEKRTAAVLRRFYERQGRVVLPKLGTKSSEDWWDTDRWNGELTKDLYDISMTVSSELGQDAMNDLGAPDPYDADKTTEYLTAIMATRAESMNEATKQQIVDALEAQAEAEADEEDPPGPADVFDDDVLDQRSLTGAATIMTTVAGVAMSEAGKQAAPGGGATKTWIVNTSNSRHPEMDGETVGIDEAFSNGAQWPGDSSLGPDETAGCQCELQITIP